MYLGAALETTRHVCFALFTLLCPTPSSPTDPLILSIVSGQFHFDNMRNKTEMDVTNENFTPAETMDPS